MGHTETDVPSVVALTKHVPLQVGLVVENLFQVARPCQFCEALELNIPGVVAAMNGACDVAMPDIFQQRDVLRGRDL
jgi:hypothetical protein